METKNTPNPEVTPTTNTDNTSVQQEKPAMSFVCTVPNLPIALAGEEVKQPVRVSLKFEYADIVTETESKKTWIRLFFKGLSIPVFRNLLQAGSDLGDYIDKDTAKMLSALGMKSAYNKHYANKEVYGSLSAHDIDSKYIVDRNSTAYTEGINGVKYQIGDVLNSKSAGVRVEGFLSAPLTEAENNAIYERELLYAREKSAKIASGATFDL